MSAIIPEPPLLPSLPTDWLVALTESLNIPRTVLASDDEIKYAWQGLPREIREIPPSLRGELIVRMCVAVSTGLFDGAMNYIWNAAILQLRTKVKNFGLSIVAQIRQSDFEEKHLVELQDSRLLELSLKLDLLSEEGFFLLNQCREVRNKFSAAHPTLGTANDREFTTFLNRCVKYALADTSYPKGVDIPSFISAVKGEKFTTEQSRIWVQRLRETHDAQRQMLIGMVYGIYCDPNTSESSRLNSLDICDVLKIEFTSSTRSDLINKHNEYAAKGEQARHAASRIFFEKLGLLTLLNESEQHEVFHRAVERLWNIHNEMNNFYNEPPFAERLLELSRQGAVPETAREEFVEVVVCCCIGNDYGVSRAAKPSYDEIITSFSPSEIVTMLNLAASPTNVLGRRVKQNSNCYKRFKQTLNLIAPESVPSGVKTQYEKFLK